jgi:hypothetical protein
MDAGECNQYLKELNILNRKYMLTPNPHVSSRKPGLYLKSANAIPMIQVCGNVNSINFHRSKKVIMSEMYKDEFDNWSNTEAMWIDVPLEFYNYKLILDENEALKKEVEEVKRKLNTLHEIFMKAF